MCYSETYMGERLHHEMAMSFAEVMLLVMETDFQQGKRDPDAMMCRLKDLSAYSLTHAGILDQQEGVELLALGMFFGMTSNPQILNRNQNRLTLLSEETFDYQGQAELVEQEIAARNAGTGQQKKKKLHTHYNPVYFEALERCNC